MYTLICMNNLSIFFFFKTGSKLSEDSRKYGSENTCTSGNTLSRAALSFGRARAQMEKEHGILLKSLGTQVRMTPKFNPMDVFG